MGFNRFYKIFFHLIHHLKTTQLLDEKKELPLQHFQNLILMTHKDRTNV